MTEQSRYRVKCGNAKFLLGSVDVNIFVRRKMQNSMTGLLLAIRSISKLKVNLFAQRTYSYVISILFAPTSLICTGIAVKGKLLYSCSRQEVFVPIGHFSRNLLSSLLILFSEKYDILRTYFINKLIKSCYE